MSSYRVYFLDSQDHIRAAREFEAETDEAALRTAREFASGQVVELWNRKRFIGRLDQLLDLG